MKLGRPALWITLASALLVLWFVWEDRARVSPGALSAAHAQDPALADSGCQRCHRGSASEMASACSECHAEIGRQLAERTGFHGQLEDAARCGRCHSEHHGSQFQLVSPGAFALAGVPERERYEHAGLGLALKGRHARLACKDCHENADVEPLPAGAQRFLGEDARCAACHADPHAGTLPDCASCHGEERPFAEVAGFRHTPAFPLEGSHAGLACARCHADEGAHSLEALAAQPGTKPRGCQACHESPHSVGFLAAAHARSDGCQSCHASQPGGFARAEGVLAASFHTLTGFPLAPPHAELACAQCHPGGSAPRTAQLARRPDDCAACHADPHAGQFGAQGCLECHERERFEPPAFGLAEHARTALPLEGAHARAQCSGCHALEGGVRRFHGLGAACIDCHRDVHGPAFAGTPACQECHTSESFAAARAGFEHGLHTGFVLEGAHARSTCEACHPALATPVDGRTRARAAGTTCFACHADAHRGAFPAAQGCAACHDADSFAHAAQGFDHAGATGFALAGAHARAACASCHAPLAAPDERGRSFGFARVDAAAAAASCSACHADPHAGSFRKAQGCADCHDQERFALARAGFDHARWTGFALTGKHSGTSCEACHVPTAPTTPAGSGQRLGRAAGTACADCHVDEHAGQFEQNGRTDCARCHASTQSFRATPGFDHQRHARFALDATHAKLACSACHVPWALENGESAVRYKPLGTLCGDCHDPRR